MNTETKELLELAAKAIGLTPVDKGPFAFYVAGDRTGAVKRWNPLNSADDLVEMECQKCLDLVQGHTTIIAQTGYPHQIVIAEHVSNHPSRRAARALASLRVVAEIGRRMK